MEDLLEVIRETYTVQRTSGILDKGWHISYTCGIEPSVKGPSASKHGIKDPGVWRIHLNNSENGEGNPYACGWRRIETIHPTRLSGNEDAIKEWRELLINSLEVLEVRRLAIN
jgi:hypothetical protein